MRQDYDVIVVGSGAGAMTAAVTAAQGGLKVLVLEKADVVGGMSATSGGVGWIPNNLHMAAAGIEDSSEKALRYLSNMIGNRARPDILKAYVEAAPKMLAYMEAHTEARFQISGHPDYHTDIEGSVDLGRSLAAREYHGRALGPAFSWLRRPLKDNVVFGSMMVGGDDIAHFMRMDRSLTSFLHLARLGASHILETLIYGRGARLLGGAALLARLLRSAIDAGVDIRRSSPAVRLLGDETGVTGVVFRDGGAEVEARARRGVVLSAGGFPHDPVLKAQKIAHPDQHVTFAPETDSGDGLHMALARGGRLGEGNLHNYLGTQANLLHDRKGNVVGKMLYMRRDRNMPGFILVNRGGRRFVSEAAAYNQVAHAMDNTPDAVPSFLITDHRGVRRHALGLHRGGPGWRGSLRGMQRAGHVISAPTLRDLALKLGIDPAGLTETVERNNDYAKTGRDLEFHKGETVYERWSSDLENKPSSNLGSIDEAPFHAVLVWPGDLGTTCGLVADAAGRVLDSADKPIAGLYACGTDMHSAFSGYYPGGGSSIGPGMTFGWLAARDMLRAAAADGPGLG